MGKLNIAINKKINKNIRCINMENKLHIKNIFLNSIMGMMSYIFVMLSTFVTRIFFVRYMSKELLGLNGLFTSILQLLQVAELGIGAAMTIFLYASLNNKDKEKTKSLINMYKKIYRIFAICLLVIGIIIQELVLKYIVHVSINFNLVRLYYFLFLVGIVCSYVMAYYKSILYAEQKNRIVSGINGLVKVILAILQIIVLILYKSYILFLILLIIGYLAENILCYIYISKQHAYLKEKDIKPLSKKDKQEVFKLVKPIFITQLADRLLAQTDSVLIDIYVNIITLGIYSNYRMIFSACIGLFNPVGAALTSSYGNLSVTADANRKYLAYRKSHFSLHILVVSFCAYYLCLVQDFIIIAYGVSFLLSETVSILITIYLYLSLVKTIYYSIQNAMGLQKLDQMYTLIQVGFNIVVSIILAKFLGLNGIILGTILSLLVFPMIFKGKLLYEVAFQKNSIEYFKITAIDYIKTTIIICACYLSCKLINVVTILGFIAKLLITTVVLIMFIILMYSKSIYMKDLISMLKIKLRKE
jgi:O-antigen/teichoic acid export membrane protein